MYIYQLPDWPRFFWEEKNLLSLMTEISFLRGKILGEMQHIGFDLQQEANLEILTEDICHSNALEGEHLPPSHVRSSIARRLKIHGDSSATDPYSDGAAEMMLDALSNYQKPLTLERLFSWHASLFPRGYSFLSKIKVAQFRDDAEGPMEVISFQKNLRIVHFQAPPAAELRECVLRFLNWSNQNSENSLLKAAIAHLWFVTLHPFEDGNGRISRAIAEMMLSRADRSPYRFYSMSRQIHLQKESYYDVLERTQKGSLDITEWLTWFLERLKASLLDSENILVKIRRKAVFWQTYGASNLNNDQRKMLNLLLDGFRGNLTTTRWSKICHCSQDTATRAINALVFLGILERVGSGRGTHYQLISLYLGSETKEKTPHL